MAAQETGDLDPADLPPKLPDWLNDVWLLYMRVGTQRNQVGGLDYNPVIKLVESAGASEHLWTILELLQVIEMETAKKDEASPDGQ